MKFSKNILDLIRLCLYVACEFTWKQMKEALREEFIQKLKKPLPGRSSLVKAFKFFGHPW